MAGLLEPSGTSQNHLELVASDTGQPHPLLTEPPAAPHGWCCARSSVCCSPQSRSSDDGEGGFSLRWVSLFLMAWAAAAASAVPVPPGHAEHAVVWLGWKVRNLLAPQPRVSADAAGFAAWGGTNGPDRETHQKFKFHLKPLSCCCGIACRSH